MHMSHTNNNSAAEAKLASHHPRHVQLLRDSKIGAWMASLLRATFSPALVDKLQQDTTAKWTCKTFLAMDL
jgi:hypothetical protein